MDYKLIAILAAGITIVVIFYFMTSMTPIKNTGDLEEGLTEDKLPNFKPGNA